MSDDALRVGLSALLNKTILTTAPQRIEGGCSNPCFRYETDGGSIFVKTAPIEALTIFEAEVAGLAELHAANVIRVPAALGVGSSGDRAVLVLEWLELHKPTPGADAQLGEQLALLHRITQPKYGWRQNNFIGATNQPNVWSTDWVHFWRTHRLGVQLNFAMHSGADARFMERATLLSALMDGFFMSYVPEPSLLHGDLWHGNYAADQSNTPVIFDPAVYYGDRECDLAMTRLFGDFGREFYAAYQSAWSLDTGYKARIDLYNLYHVLNHHNLFGGGYLARAETMIERLLAELGH